MSNDRSFEACLCPSGQGVVEFACNCEGTPVFLCRSCIITHLTDPRSHTLIPLEQARALNEQSQVDNTQHIDKLNCLKSKLEGYHSTLAEFTCRIRAAKSDIISRIDRVFDSRISQLEDISDEVMNKIEEISRQKVTFDQVGCLMLEKFDVRGIEGVITRYYDSLNFYEDDIQHAIDNSLFIGRSSEIIMRFPYRDLAKYNEVYEENNKLKGELDKYVRYYEDLRKTYAENALGTKYFSSLNYEECAERYKIYIKDTKLVCLDKIKNQRMEYKIKLSEDMTERIKCCLSPDGYLFLVGNSDRGKTVVEKFFSRTIPPSSEYCDTFKIDLDQFKTFKLSNMNVRRDCVALICKGEYLYAFGGQNITGSNSKVIERFSLKSQTWHKISEMIRPVINGTCYSYKNFIIIRDTCMDLQYFDENNLQFYEIQNLDIRGDYGPGMIKSIDDRIFILYSKKVDQNKLLAVLSDEMQVMYVNKALEPNTYFYFPHYKEENIETVCIKVNDTSITFHDVFKPNYDMIKEVRLIIPTSEEP
jgi:hypothetical protein